LAYIRGFKMHAYIRDFRMLISVALERTQNATIISNKLMFKVTEVTVYDKERVQSSTPCETSKVFNVMYDIYSFQRLVLQ